ncbi:hypothetical protein BDV29DRAFT_181772 [Aspergillus leporis]|uniref:Uncharacterized protein n=1 Tax=Aspergillus leporis TaxID=41062 RepID=A0A5N5WQ95_9EURO|nr:hypothetical protein BDV29DRAFT_181772 [Aspergillus leporis]
MARLLAVVANPLALGFSGTVPGNMSNLSTVVALLTLSAVTSHVTEATARVAGLLTATKSTSVVATLRAVPCNVAHPAALVTLLATSSTAVAIARGSLGAFTRDMANAAAAVTGLLLGSYCTFTANMSLSCNPFSFC